MNTHNIPDFLIRAAKTFVQAFVPILIANIAAILTHVVNWDFADWKGWLLPILISAASAGIAAVWNFIREKLENKEMSQVFKEMSSDEVENFINKFITEVNKSEEELQEDDSQNEI